MNLIYLFEKKYSKMLYKQFAWFTEHLNSNQTVRYSDRNFDAALYAMSPEMWEKMMPELVIRITAGVEDIVSKRMKNSFVSIRPRSIGMCRRLRSD